MGGNFNWNVDSWHPVLRILFWTVIIIWFIGMLFSPFYLSANGIYD